MLLNTVSEFFHLLQKTSIFNAGIWQWNRKGPFRIVGLLPSMLLLVVVLLLFHSKKKMAHLLQRTKEKVIFIWEEKNTKYWINYLEVISPRIAESLSPSSSPQTWAKVKSKPCFFASGNFNLVTSPWRNNSPLSAEHWSPCVRKGLDLSQIASHILTQAASVGSPNPSSIFLLLLLQFPKHSQVGKHISPFDKGGPIKQNKTNHRGLAVSPMHVC